MFFLVDILWNPQIVWREIKPLSDRISLYPASYDVERVRKTLQNARVVFADSLNINNAFKFTMILDGNQKVLFKPRTR